MAKNIGTLGNFDQRRLWKLICIVNPFDLLLKKSNLLLNIKNLKCGEISFWNVFFSSNTRWTQLLVPLEILPYGAFPYGSLLGGFPLGTVPGTWYFFSTTSAVPLPKRDV